MRNFASTLVKFSKLSHIQTTIWRPPKMAPPPPPPPALRGQRGPLLRHCLFGRDFSRDFRCITSEKFTPTMPYAPTMSQLCPVFCLNYAPTMHQHWTEFPYHPQLYRES